MIPPNHGSHIGRRVDSDESMRVATTFMSRCPEEGIQRKKIDTMLGYGVQVNERCRTEPVDPAAMFRTEHGG